MESRHMTKRWERGFSLMEALVVLALIGAMLAISIPLLGRFLRNYRLQTAASEFAVQLRFARNAAVKQKLKYRIVINENPTNTYRVEKETNYATNTFELVPGIAGYTDIRLPIGVVINSASTDGPIVFTFRGSNDGNATYNVIFDTATNTRYTITVTPSGGVTTTRTYL